MGYYTDYTLTVHEGEVNFNELSFAFEEETSYTPSVTKTALRLFDVKWYNHIEDMVEFSKAYPAVTFRLEGVGEETGDLWVKYFKNGKCVKYEPVVQWPEFDPKDLK